ncbi:hypothetical protein V6Z11_D12G180100 [Gossypium hirsutum]
MALASSRFLFNSSLVTLLGAHRLMKEHSLETSNGSNRLERRQIKESMGGSFKEISSYRNRCLAKAKEQKSRFYILWRCAIMLLCWHKHEDS